MGVFFQNLVHHADVVELVDTLDSGSSAREGMKVQVLSSALKNPVVRYRVFRFFFTPTAMLYANRANHAAVMPEWLRMTSLLGVFLRGCI